MANIFLIRSSRAGLAGLVLALGVGLAAQGQSQTPNQSAVVPLFVSGQIPQVLPITIQAKLQAHVVVKVTTDGERVSAVELLRPVPMFSDQVLEAIRTWRFAPHRPTTFETAVYYTFRSAEPVCYNQDRNTHWSLELPLRIDVRPVGVVFCEDGPTKDGGRASRLRGRLRCECPGNPGVAGVVVTAEPRPHSGRPVHVTTGKDGWFEFSSTLPGQYWLSTKRGRFLEETWIVTVDPADERPELDLKVEIDNKTVPSPQARVVARDAAIYPEAARLAGIEGVAQLRVGVDRSLTVLGGPPELTSAALANVKSWTFQEGPKEAFDIGFRYVLMPGDCSGDQNARVTMKLPLDVEIIAKRPAKCGG